MPRRIVLQWSDVCRWDRKVGLPDEATGVGIYQITRVFAGYEVALYIGIVWSDTRNFKIRIREHRAKWLGELRGIHFRFATILPDRGLSRTRELVEEIEGALIFHLRPPHNSSKLNSYSIRHDLLIRSVGDIGLIPRLVDTTRH